MGLLNRLGIAVSFVYPVIPAVISRFVLSPHGFEELNAFVQLPDALGGGWKRVVEGFVLLAQRPGPQTDRQAAIADGIHGRNDLGQQGRVAEADGSYRSKK